MPFFSWLDLAKIFHKFRREFRSICLKEIVKEEYHKWHSQYFEHEFEMLVFGSGGHPLIIFPALNESFFELKDNGIIESASNLLDSGKIKIYCPQSIDYLTWNNRSIAPADRAKSYTGYENVVLFDIIDFARHETGKEKAALAGFNFGAYHAANISFKHPDLVDALICLDGIFDIKNFLDGYYDDNCYFNNPPDYLPGLKDNWYLDRIKKIKIILEAGEINQNSRQTKIISGLLDSKDVGHKLDFRPNFGDDWDFWCEVFPQYLQQIFE